MSALKQLQRRWLLTFVLDLAVPVLINHLHDLPEHVLGILHCYPNTEGYQ